MMISMIMTIQHEQRQQFLYLQLTQINAIAQTYQQGFKKQIWAQLEILENARLDQGSFQKVKANNRMHTNPFILQKFIKIGKIHEFSKAQLLKICEIINFNFNSTKVHKNHPQYKNAQLSHYLSFICHNFTNSFKFFQKIINFIIQIKSKMPNSERKYMKIDYQTRTNLITYLNIHQGQFKQAANHFNIKLSTARAIYKKYKQDGQVFQKKQDKLRRTLTQKIKNQSRWAHNQQIKPTNTEMEYVTCYQQQYQKYSQQYYPQCFPQYYPQFMPIQFEQCQQYMYYCKELIDKFGWSIAS